MDETQPFRAAGQRPGGSGRHAEPTVMEPPSGGGSSRRWQADPHAAHDCCHIVNKQSSWEGGNHVLALKEALVT